jgi:hypothetical protein
VSVYADGAIIMSTGITAVYHDAEGVYHVTFPSDTTTCTPVASLGLNAPTQAGFPGEISFSRISGSSNILQVRTFDSAGAPKDRPFNLMLACP